MRQLSIGHAPVHATVTIVLIALLVLALSPVGAAPAEAATTAAPGSVTWAQQRLIKRGFLRDRADGIVGPKTSAAVLAFEKSFGLKRDGRLDPTVMKLLARSTQPPLRGHRRNRIEVDLDRQVVHVVRNGRRIGTLNASSGNGERYGRGKVANTPVGGFTVQRRITGVRTARLGTLYDPLYFYGGYAIHGSNRVPATEASHGCIRVNRWDARWLQRRVPNGIAVRVRGGRHTFRVG